MEPQRRRVRLPRIDEKRATKFTICTDNPDEPKAQTISRYPDLIESNLSPSKSWDQYKENILPLKQGRKIDALLYSLPLIDRKSQREIFIKERKKEFEEELSKQDDLDKRLDIWCNHIEWLEQNVPDGGKDNELTTIIESCIEIYYNKKEFKQDKRLFNVFMKFKRFCDEPIEVFGFMYANSICILLAEFYLNWSWQYEIRKNVHKAENLLKLGLKNLASPTNVLEEALSQLKYRIARMIRNGALDECPESTSSINAREAQSELESGDIRAALQTLKFRVTKKTGVSKVAINRIGSNVDQTNIGGLKSQTKVVNGVRQTKASKSSSSSLSSSSSNVPLQVFKDGRGAVEEVGPRIPTTQRLETVGRDGAENRQTHTSRLKLGQLTTNR